MDEKLKVFYTRFPGVWPVGAGMFLCVAPDMVAAKAMLHREMYDAGLKRQYATAEERLKEVATDSFAEVIDFRSGDY